MATRSVSVVLRASVAPFVAGFRTAEGAVGRLNRQVMAMPGQVGGAVGRAGRQVSQFENTLSRSTGRQKEAFDRLGRSGTVMAVGLVGGFALATKASMDFDRQMSAVKSVAGATSAQLGQLRQAALDAGRTTAYSATQAAKAEEELAKAGVSASDVIGGALKGSLSLAAAGTLDVGEAAETAATAMTQFGLSGKDVPHIADLLAAGANKAQGEVHDLGYALKMGGLVGHQFGLSIEDTTGTLSAFASAGLIGRDSGTSFKTMLLHLANPTGKTSELMKELGINVYDAQGKFIGITALADVLRQKLGHLTEAQRNQALAQIFGTDAIRAANILYQQGGAGIQSWINRVNDSGYAAKTAATKLNNLHGDLLKLKGAFTTAAIGAGEGAQSPLRGLVQTITGVVNAFNAMPPAAKSATFWIAGISGAAILGAKGLIFMVTTVKDARIALTALGLTSERVAGMIAGTRTALAATASFLTGPWGIAIATAVAAWAVWEHTKSNAAKATQEFTDAVRQDSGAIGENTRAAVANKLETEGILRNAQRVGLNLSQVTDAVLGNANAYKAVTQQLDAYMATQKAKAESDKGGNDDAVRNYAAAMHLKQAIDGQNGSLKASVSAAQRQAAATQTSATAQQGAAAAADQHTGSENQLTRAMTDATQTADDLQKALDALSKANLDADQAAINQAKAVQDAAKAADHRAGASLKEKQALIDVAQADQKQLVSLKESGATTDELARKQNQLRNQFIKLATAMLGSRSEALKLAQRYGLVSAATSSSSNVIGGYIGRVRSAASAASNLASKMGDGASAQKRYTGTVQNALPVLYALAGRNQSARAQVDALAHSAGVVAGKMNVSHDAFINAAGGMKIARDKAEDLWNQLQKIKDRHASLTVTANGTWTEARAASHSYHGGPITGEGQPGASRHRDSVRGLLRVGEHVWTPEEVDAVGGHAAMYRLRRQARSGKLRATATDQPASYQGRPQQAFATGGAVLGQPGSVDAVMHPINEGYQHMFDELAAALAAAWKKFAQSGGAVVAAARSQIGLPYSWGGGGTGGPSYGIGRGAGTYGFDCSGLTEYAWYQGRHIDIGGVTNSQWASSTPISGPRPGALAFPSGPSVHVMLGSSRPGYVIQAPHTGAFVEEVPRSASMWRWPNSAGFATGGEVKKVGANYIAGRLTREEWQVARRLGIAGDPGPKGYSRERHVAQIAPASGPIRVWNEDETGGEAYIPLAASKRNRSKAILAQVARSFGMTVKGMADGGILGFADGGITDEPNLNLGDILQRWADQVGPATAGDVSSAKKNVSTQKSQVDSARRALAKAEQARRDRIHEAEKRLERARKSHNRNRIQDAKDDLAKARRTDKIRDAEARLKKERNDLADATKKLHDTERRYKAGAVSPATKLGSALGLNIKNTGAFIANLTKLADRGFGLLAQQLLAMGDPEAEKIAADAVKMSDSKLKGLQGQLQTSQRQQQTLQNLPNILSARSALKKLGASGGSWTAMLNATGLSPGDLAAALHLIEADLMKTSTGQALLADMRKHGYVHGGWITGPGGVDRVPLMATSGEFMVRERQAAKFAPLVEAINSDRVGDALLRRYIRNTGGGPVRGGDGASAPAPHIEQHFHEVPFSPSQMAREAAREAAWQLRAS